MQTHNFNINFKLTLPSRRVFAAAGAIAVLVAGLGTVWVAVNDDRGTSNLLAGGIVVPYDGFLMVDGNPVDRAMDVIFELWDDPSSIAPANLIWSESHTAGNAVTFHSGRFSVGLGSGAHDSSTKSIDDAILDGDQLYLAIQLYDTTAGAWVKLSGRQKIEAVPYAAWSASAADFQVEGNLTVDGATELKDSLTLTKSGADATLLTFNTDRPWRFSQTGLAEAAHLRLSTDQGKWFQIMTGTGVNGLQVGTAAGVVGFTAAANGDVSARNVSATNLTFSGRVNGFSISEYYGATGVDGTSDDVPLISSADGYCSLVQTYTWGSAAAICQVYLDGGGNWRMQAASDAVGTGVLCSAVCLLWN
jgi:hypothetical protein